MLALFLLLEFALAASPTMSFFITSVGIGNGVKFGGLAGADAHCAMLANAVGVNKTWRAYLSTVNPPVNARDRIGTGPWYNANGTLIATSVANLHGYNGTFNNVTTSMLGKTRSLNELGRLVNGRGDSPNQHDIITGSTIDGRSINGSSALNATCSDYTSNSVGSVRVGHHDLQGGGEFPYSWNSAHLSRNCSQVGLVASGGNGYFYCFALEGAGNATTATTSKAATTTTSKAATTTTSKAATTTKATTTKATTMSTTTMATTTTATTMATTTTATTMATTMASTTTASSGATTVVSNNGTTTGSDTSVTPTTTTTMMTTPTTTPTTTIGGSSTTVGVSTSMTANNDTSAAAIPTSSAATTVVSSVLAVLLLVVLLN